MTKNKQIIGIEKFQISDFGISQFHHISYQSYIFLSRPYKPYKFWSYILNFQIIYIHKILYIY